MMAGAGFRAGFFFVKRNGAPIHHVYSSIDLRREIALAGPFDHE